MNSQAINFTTANVSKLTYSVLIENDTEQNWSATVLGWSDRRATGKTQQEALANLRQQIAERLAKAEIVQIEIDNPHYENPWIKLAGKYKDDPQFEEMLAYIEAYRRELDAETQFDDAITTRFTTQFDIS